MKFNQQAVLNASVDEVDLEEWLFTLSDSEYRRPRVDIAVRASSLRTECVARSMSNRSAAP